MGHKLSIDFGTTNTVVARWDDASSSPHVLALPPLTSLANQAGIPSVIPSLVYVQDAAAGRCTVGQPVRDGGLDRQADNRLFRNFKRGIVALPPPEPRRLDGRLFGDSDAGEQFIAHLMNALPYSLDAIEQIVLTAPVASFEGYITWLNGVIKADHLSEKLRILDESTAAALGYAVTKPKAIVLLVDFGGGTLDLSLVELPEGRENIGGFLRRLLKGGAAKNTARVIAKAGRVIGGSDVDQWVLADVLERTGLTALAEDHHAPLLTECERAKIVLSSEEITTIHLEAGDQALDVPYTRAALEAALTANGFYLALRRVVDKVLYAARQRGIFKEDVDYVLLVGGTSLMPSVQRTLQQVFPETPVRSEKPFTAVAEGALRLAAGLGLEDHLAHSCGLRYLDPNTGAHAYDEIFPMGSHYPSAKPVEILLGAAHDEQHEMEFVIAETDTEGVALIEVRYENGQAVFVAQGNEADQHIALLNGERPLVAQLVPPVERGRERFRAEFSVDDQRYLHVRLTDLRSGKRLLENAILARLR
jgi:molecular chaperone DnaK (HSP70)